MMIGFIWGTGNGDSPDTSSQRASSGSSAGQMLAATPAAGSPSGWPVAQTTVSPLPQPSIPTSGPGSADLFGQFNGPVPMPLPPVPQPFRGPTVPSLGQAPGPFPNPALPQLAPGPFLPALPNPLTPALGPALPLQGAPTPSGSLPRPIPEPTTGVPVTYPQPGPAIQAVSGLEADAPAPSSVREPAVAGHEATPSESCVRVSHVLPTGGVFIECVEEGSPSQPQGIVPLWEASPPSSASRYSLCWPFLSCQAW